MRSWPPCWNWEIRKKNVLIRMLIIEIRTAQTNILGNFELLPNVALSILSPKCNCVFKAQIFMEPHTLCMLYFPGTRRMSRSASCWNGKSFQTQSDLKSQKALKGEGETWDIFLGDTETFTKLEALFELKMMTFNEHWNSSLTTGRKETGLMAEIGVLSMMVEFPAQRSNNDGTNLGWAWVTWVPG